MYLFAIGLWRWGKELKICGKRLRKPARFDAHTYRVRQMERAFGQLLLVGALGLRIKTDALSQFGLLKSCAARNLPLRIVLLIGLLRAFPCAVRVPLQPVLSIYPSLFW